MKKMRVHVSMGPQSDHPWASAGTAAKFLPQQCIRLDTNQTLYIPGPVKASCPLPISFTSSSKSPDISAFGMLS